MATKTNKAPRKRATKSTPKRTAKNGKQSAKQTATKQTIKLRAVKLTNADGSKRTVNRPVEPHQYGRGGTTRQSQYAAAADRASELVCTDASGQPMNRARIGTEQIARVAKQLGTTKPRAALHRLIGGKSAAESFKLAVGWADGRVGISELPDGARDRVREFATGIGDPAKHKVSGKAVAGALVGLADHPAKRTK